jgi:hypothetical protein
VSSKASRILERLSFVRGEKVLAHVGGPSGSGKTELVNALQPKIRNITLMDLDEFDERAEHIMGLSGMNKNDYTDAMLREHHNIKQKLINNFIQRNQKPIIFFGHIEEAGRIIRIPTSIRILLSTNPRSSAVRRYKNREMTPDELRDLIRTGHADVKYLKGQGYIPMNSRQVYSMVLGWDKKIS